MTKKARVTKKMRVMKKTRMTGSEPHATLRSEAHVGDKGILNNANCLVSVLGDVVLSVAIQLD